jgi:DnaJ-domain-containing protein 1
MSNSTGRDSDKFMLRLPDGMRDRIKLAADRNNRSMNAEIVATLEDAYPQPKPDVTLSDIDRLIAYAQDSVDLDQLEARLDEANRFLAGTGAELVTLPGRNGLPVIVIRSASADEKRLRALGDAAFADAIAAIEALDDDDDVASPSG